MGNFHFFDFVTFFLPGLIPWTGIYLLLKIYHIDISLVTLLESNSAIVTAGLVTSLSYITGHAYRVALKEWGRLERKYKYYPAIKTEPVLAKIVAHPNSGYELSVVSPAYWKEFVDDAYDLLYFHEKASLVIILEAQYKFMHNCSAAFITLLACNGLCFLFKHDLTLFLILSLLLVSATLICLFISYNRCKMTMVTCCKTWLLYQTNASSKQ